ncbi:MAG: MipA/OmpV family protein [Congregibacter sp.]
MQSKLDRRTFKRVYALLISAALLPLSFKFVAAEELPLWEMGFGVGGVHQPYYPGSSEQRTVAFPVPLPIYRGDIFKSDDQGTRADLLQNSLYKVSISADFNFPVASEDVDIREGMDDIGSMLQIGPSMEINLKETERSNWSVVLPLRVNLEFSSDGVEENGFTFAPTLYYTRYLDIGNERWQSRFSLGAAVASSGYNNLYYGVSERFATTERRQYRADEGFSGLRAQVSMRSLNRKRLWVGFLRYDDVAEATFSDSPLVETTGGVTIGFIYSRLFWRSKATVNR